MTARRTVLRRLEDLAQCELRQMCSTRQEQLPLGQIDDPIWLGLAWDMGLTGSNVADAALPVLPSGELTNSDTTALLSGQRREVED